MVEIAVMGHGVVGSGVVEVIVGNRENITNHAKEDINVKYILDLRDFPDTLYANKFIKDFNIILNDPDVRIVVETMGGIHPAYEYVKACLQAGKSVVTSNKELVAAKGAELLAIAKEKNVNFLFEASVGGGIPILRPISQCLAANEVYDIAGILNGTTNYILTKMIHEHTPFDKALETAQKKGFAERNPEADIEGHDACRKICILASLSFGEHIYPENVHTEGISKITSEDVDYAASGDYSIKLIGRARRHNDSKVEAWVAPALVPSTCQLSTVDGVFNGIIVWGNVIGEVMFYGKGAGKLPTASAVVADVIDCVKHLKSRKYLFWRDGSTSDIKDYSESKTAMYVRVCGKNAKDAVKNVYGEVKPLHRENQPDDELAFVTDIFTIKDHEHKMEELKTQGARVLGSLRVF
ncbi:MAG: homoserine dehydrogenase [Clostridia bacterium]|nr:homoserine dehydrogenase [Clostridia bacterium]